MENLIKISASSPRVTIIDIEGIIGTPEECQFEESGNRVATYEKFKNAVGQIGRIQSREVVVNIRSTGGSVADALMIYDALVSLQAHVTTRCWGYVASAATIIAQGASKGRREMSANGLYLIHKSVSAAQGNGNQLSQTVELLNKTDQRIASIYAGRAGKDTATFITMMGENNGNGRWLSPQEALEASLIDKIIESAPIANDIRQTIGQQGLPPLPENNTNPKIMTLTEKWNAILQIIAQSENTENEEWQNQAQEQIARLNNDYRQQIEALQNRIAELEAASVRAKAGPTTTKRREDASLGDPKRTPNQEAYMADVQKFR